MDVPPPEQAPNPVPPPKLEWILAAMIGLGAAFCAAGVIAYVETSRFGPAPPAEAGANEWATPRPRPSKSASASSAVSAMAAESYELDLDDPIIDVSIRGSASQ